MRRTIPLLFGAALAFAAAGGVAQAAPLHVSPAVLNNAQPAADVMTVENENYGWRRHRDWDDGWRHHRRAFRHDAFPYRYSFYDPWPPRRYHRRHHHHDYPYSYHRRPGITFEFSF